MKIINIIKVITIISFINAPAALAADFFFDPSDIKAGVGESFTVDLLLDTGIESINAIEGKLSFPNELLEVQDINDGNSLISFWIERPSVILNDSEESQRDPSQSRLDGKSRRAASPQDDGSTISFAGVVPGGYTGFRGKLFSIKFAAKEIGNAAIELSDFAALLNDGEGTAADVSFSPIKVSIVDGPVLGTIEEIKDEDPPGRFRPEISQNPNLFDNQYFLVFSAQDKGSGIDFYEINEERHILLRPSPKEWEKADSPYLLKDQELKSWVFVKAVDKQGNERVAVVSPKNIPFYQRGLTILIGIILILLVILIIKRRETRDGRRGTSKQYGKKAQ